MSTATSTLTKHRQISTPIPLKGDLKPSAPPVPPPNGSAPMTAQTSTSATLRSLYTRAARAFVLRDISTTYSLIQSAFAILRPPKTSSDTLSDDRRKWDILRITFESTVYTSPPTSNESMPESLRDALSEAPQALAMSIYTRSLGLFTPSSGISHKPTLNAASLPSQVLSTLVYCSLKLDAPDVGRVMIEDWLARRQPQYSPDEHSEGEGDGYEKILELYCLHVLPKLEQWDYAMEFLEYESELPVLRRENLKTSLKNLHVQTLSSQQPFKLLSSPSPSPVSSPAFSSTSTSPRSYSPAPSSSSSSSVSTTSTHTVVPSTSRQYRSSGLSSVTAHRSASSSSASASSNETATPRAPHVSLSNGHHHPFQSNGKRPASKSRTQSSASSAYSSLPRSNVAHEVSSTRPGTFSTYALIKASIAPYLSSPRLTTFLLIFVLVPLISFIMRMRRRRHMALLGPLASGEAGPLVLGGLGTVTAASNADLVRRRLHAAGSEGGLISRTWGEVVRVVSDTVRMAGSGLV